MLYLFDKNENLIDELASDEIESSIQHEELNKLMTLEFAVFIDSNDKMEDIEYVAHKDMEDYEKIQMYRVISSESDDYTVNYQAVHIIFDELKAYGYIRDKRPDKAKASAALGIALAGSRWKVGRVDDSDLLSTNFYDLTRLDALSKIIKTRNLDLHFYLTFDGNKITGRYVDLLEFRGEDTGERFVYGSNALEVVKEVDVSEVYTRIIPRGKGEEKVDEEGKPTDGYGRRIKIDDVVWEKSKGDPIDKPKDQEYIELKEMTSKFGFSDGEPRTRVQIFEDIEDPKELIKAGYDFLVKVSRPLVQFKTKIEKKSRTNVGDIVRIIRKDLDFYYRTRIYKAHRNLLNETLEVEFGDKLVQSPADREKIVSYSLNSLEERIKETETDLKSSFVDKVNEGITHATFNRDGYNYELKKGNKYGLPAGYYSFDREIDDNPQRVIYVGAGTLAIADSKKSNGDWNFRTFGTGQGFVADLLVAGTILGGKVRWNLEDGTLLIGNSPDDYNLYWDGETLNLRNTDIDLSNNVDIEDMKKSISLKVSRGDIISEINQSPEQVKIRANKIDLEGSAVNIKGTLQTLNSTDDIGIKIDYNQIHFQDNRRQGYRFGMINVNKLWYKDRAFSLNLGHYQEGFLSVGWYKDDWKEWEPYIVFDRWGKSTYATEGYSIRVLDTINFDKTALFKGNVVINNSTTFNDECKFERNITFGGNRIKIVNYSDGLGFVNGNGEGLFIEGSGAVYLMDTQYKYRVAKE
ncbi:phage tail spike protein [Anaerococcus vaginalis]|uniref:phage tail spike protein n=1 Tax=Anaerococcus vaginalis TaxID=33037 RepID=UPI0029147F17|nr:phage tail spike protein [Anaerococcus vaginalis]MDU5252706.1 phage tail spike protein [Anaerococcus vaginalis]MDU6781463.1 phage tail spike protein [Anaerococcus vaginalis]